jgi:hypothetical protein
MVLTGTTSLARLESACMTTGIGGDIWVTQYLKKTAGTSISRVAIQEYSAANCAGFLQTTDLHNGDVTLDTWLDYGGIHATATWHGSTAGYELRIIETGNNGVTILASVPQVIVRSTAPLGYCTGDTDSSASCNHVVPTIEQPLSDEGTYTIELTVRLPRAWSSTISPAGRFFGVPGTAGNNNRLQCSQTADALYCDTRDSSGTSKTTTYANAGSADTDYTIKLQHTSTGSSTACVDGSCDGTPASGATTDGKHADFYVGAHEAGNGGSDTIIRDLKIYRRIK